MYHNWNLHDPTRSLSDNSHHHCHYRLMENQNTRSVRFWILKWTDTAGWKIDYTTWYIGQVMKVPMRKLHGYQHKTSPIHPNSARYSTNDTPISQAPRIVEREFPITRCITARPPTSFFFLSYFLSFLLLCKMFPFLSVSPSKMFPLLSLPFSPSKMFPLLSFPFSPSEMFPLFHSFCSQFPWLLTFISPHTILQTSPPQYSH